MTKKTQKKQTDTVIENNPEMQTTQQTPEEKNTEFEGLYKRALADYQNLLKQTAREKEEFARYANENLLGDILPVYDNLKTAITHFKEGEEKAWRQGVEYVVKQFQSALEAAGVEEIKTEGQKFDYTTMEAMDGESEMVKKQIKAGYKLKGKVIIPAKVTL